MSALVRFHKKTAILRAGLWMSADAGLESELNRFTTVLLQSVGAPPANSDQELAVAERAAAEFGGRVTVRVKPRTKAGERHYFRQRQMGFNFEP